MDRQTAIRSAPLRDLLPVRSLNDLDWFVKEYEIITGSPGREFFVAGADQPTFRIHLDHVGYQIARVERGEEKAAPVSATAPELVRHALGDALARGHALQQILARRGFLDSLGNQVPVAAQARRLAARDQAPMDAVAPDGTADITARAGIANANLVSVANLANVGNGKKCPECGAHALHKVDGCLRCANCHHIGSCG